MALAVCNSISSDCFRLMRDWKLGNLQIGQEISIVPLRREKKTTSGGSLQFENGFTGK